MKKIVDVSHLSYRYNQSRERSLDDVSFSVSEGEFFAIVGPNSAGKSTLCNALVGLIPHFFVGAMAGKVMIDGIDIADTDIGEISTIAGLVFQNPFNQLSYTTETVREELAYGLGNRGFSRSDMFTKIKSVARKVSVEDLLERNPLELSGGQVQRVAFGSTYILDPKILVLDECTTQLDPVGSEKLIEIVKQLNSEGVTVIMVDHDMERVAKYADHILVLKDGKAKVIGTPREIFTRENASRYGIELPEVVKLSYLMIEKGYWQGEVALTEDEALSMIKKVQKNMLLEVKNLGHRYPSGEEALRGVSFSIADTSPVAIIGQNGAGKTTTVKHLNGLLRPTTGSVLINGVSIEENSTAEWAKTVGYVFQNPDNQLFLDSVKKEFEFGPKQMGMSKAQIADRLDKIVELVGLIDKLESHPFDLTATEKKFCTIGSVLMMDPKIVVLDEPTCGQDIVGNLRLRTIIRQLESQNILCITISHDMRFVVENFKRIIVMREGQVILDGDRNAVFSKTEELQSSFVSPPVITRIGQEIGLQQLAFDAQGFMAQFEQEYHR